MILPEKSSGISLSCQTLRRSPSCPLFRRSSTCSLCHFHIPTLSDHSSSIPASEKSASHGKLHGDTLSDHNPSVGITQIRYGRRSIFLSACHTSSRWLFSFLFFNIAHTYPVVKPPLLLLFALPPETLLFTPFSATRFAMHRIYANRINSRGMSRVFCDLRSQKTPRGILPVNSNPETFLIQLNNYFDIKNSLLYYFS